MVNRRTNAWTIIASTVMACSLIVTPNAKADEKSAKNGSKATVNQAAKLDQNDRPGFDWPIFLGPHGTGVSDETGLLDKWPAEGPKILWEKRVGKGYSSPSILGNRLVFHHRQRDRDLVECVRADNGESIWSYDYETDYSDPYGYNNGPRCSPILTATRCYTFGAEGKLLCLDLVTGKLIWECNTAEKWKVPQHFFGAGCTPILEDNLLIVLVGGQPDSGVVAFNPENGDVVWEAVGKKTWDSADTDQKGQTYGWTGSEMIVSYSSPIVATIHGEKHLLCLMRQGLVSLDPANGKFRFKYWFRARVHESVNAARPVVVDDMIFLSAAYETGAALLKVHPDNKSFDVVWRNKRGMSTHWSTPIYHDGCVYGFSGRHEPEATLQCVDFLTGKLVWETNGFDGELNQLRIGTAGEITTADGKPATFFGRGSKTAIDGKYIILGERGILVLANLSREKYDQISRATFEQIRYPAWASPVVSHGWLYLRSEDNLLCLDVAKSN